MKLFHEQKYNKALFSSVCPERILLRWLYGEGVSHLEAPNQSSRRFTRDTDSLRYGCSHATRCGQHPASTNATRLLGPLKDSTAPAQRPSKKRES